MLSPTLIASETHSIILINGVKYSMGILDPHSTERNDSNVSS